MLVFAGLWTQCDKEGRFEWRPRQLHLDILPFLTFDFEKTLNVLQDAGFIRRYEAGGKAYGVIPGFSEHQRINGKEAQADPLYPVPPKFHQEISTDETEKQQGSAGEAPGKHPGSQGSGRGNGNGNGTEEINCGAKDRPPYEEITHFLNENSGKSFRSSSKTTQRLIKARWAEGFRTDDFQKVIRNKCCSWRADPKMVDYLRPETLFGQKFESYLNEIKHPMTGQASDLTVKNMAALENWSPPE
ncbi:MAG: hypothetical protein HPY65_00745 [Syntrophaceae bacterium]|nr:hypothetical protein [Syntrophaceae bacterium]